LGKELFGLAVRLLHAPHSMNAVACCHPRSAPAAQPARDRLGVLTLANLTLPRHFRDQVAIGLAQDGGHLDGAPTGARTWDLRINLDVDALGRLDTST
jgi:hypothetical protein